jgi:hypothetical protein
MALESLFEIIPSDSTPLLHSLEVIHHIKRLLLAVAELRSWLYYPQSKESQRQRTLPRWPCPSLSFQGVFRLGKGRWLRPDELSVHGDLVRPLVIGPMWRPSVHLFSDLLLRLQDLA